MYKCLCSDRIHTSGMNSGELDHKIEGLFLPESRTFIYFKKISHKALETSVYFKK